MILDPSKLLAESMVIADHPNEPMVIRLGFLFNDQVPDRLYDPIQQIDVTVKLLKKYPRLTSFFRLSRQGLRLEAQENLSKETLVELAQKVWGLRGTSFDSFFKTPIKFDEAPLLRFNLRPDGIALCAHHALLDGRGSMFLLKELLDGMTSQSS